MLVGHSETKAWAQTITQEQIIREVAASPTKISVKAESILRMVFNEEFEHPIMKIDNGKRIKSDIIENKSEQNFSAKLYPNPNDGNMQLDYTISEGLGEFVIYDITGKELTAYRLKQGINTLRIIEKALKNGIYFYKITLDKKIKKRGKLIIIN